MPRKIQTDTGFIARAGKTSKLNCLSQKHGTLPYTTVSTSTYTYYTTEFSGDLRGLIKSIAADPAVGPTVTETYNYNTTGNM